MKIKELIDALSRFPENLEVAVHRDTNLAGMEGFWKDVGVREQFGFFYEDDDGFFEPIDQEEESSCRNIKFVVLK